MVQARSIFGHNKTNTSLKQSYLVSLCKWLIGRIHKSSNKFLSLAFLSTTLFFSCFLINGVALADDGLLDDDYDGSSWESVWRYDVFIGDYNDDGLDDLYLKPFSRNLPVVFLQDADSGYYTSITPDQVLLDAKTWNVSPHLSYYGDFNGDSYADLYLQTTTSGMPSAFIHGAAIGGTAQLSDDFDELGALYQAGITSGSNWPYEVLIGDYNNDGLLDLYFKSDTVYILVMMDDLSIPVLVSLMPDFVLVQDGSSEAYTQITNPDAVLLESIAWQSSDASFYYNDFNGDGIVDVLVNSGATELPAVVLIGSGNASSAPSMDNQYVEIDPVSSEPNWQDQYLFDVFVGDYDCDGDSDYLLKPKAPFVLIMMDDLLIPIQTIEEVVIQYEWVNGEAVYTEIGASDYSGCTPIWSALSDGDYYGDFNGDGVADLLLLGEDASHDTLFINGVSTGTPSISTQIDSILDYQNSDIVNITTQDVDGDGKSDLVLTLGSGYEVVVTIDDLFYASSVSSEPNWALEFDYNVFIGDYDCDGDDDYLLQPKVPFIMIMMDDLVIPIPTAVEDLVIQYQYVNGEAVYTEISPPNYGSCSPVWSELVNDIDYGDFDGDGEADLLLVGSDENHDTLIVNGNGNDSPTIGDQLQSILGYPLYEGVVIEVRDVNGDGQSDLILIIDGIEIIAAATETGSFYQSELSNQIVEGGTPGQFSVTPSGTASYSIPIAVPPGTNGVAPRLSLSYDSGGGNGLAGMGWNVSAGNGAVARCGKDIVTDGFVGGINFDADDAYCLNGQRLIEVTQTTTAGNVLKEYRTQSESWQRVVAFGGDSSNPDYWIVEDKSGEHFYYGQAGSGGHAEKDAQGKTIAWMMQRVEDPAQNYMEYHYTRNDASGEHYLSEIKYTANDAVGLDHYASAQLVYEARPDEIRGYSYGDPANTLQRLKRIDLKYGVSTVRKYDLRYDQSPTTERSRLQSVQECDGNDNCFDPLTFEWLDGAVGFETEFSQSSITMGMDDWNKDFSVPIDMDGDGDQEILIIPRLGSGTWRFFGSNSIGDDLGATFTIVGQGLNTNGNSPGDVTVESVIPANFNGDQKTDLLIVSRYDGSGGYVEYFVDAYVVGSSVFQAYNLYESQEYDDEDWIDSNAMSHRVADMNGDGLDDLVWRNAGSGEISTKLNSGLGDANFYGDEIHVGKTFSNDLDYQLVDQDGDGLIDLVHRSGDAFNWYKNTSLLNDISYAVSQSLTTLSGYDADCPATFVDLTGDGLTDIFYSIKSDNKRLYYVKYGTQDGYADPVRIVQSDNALFETAGNTCPPALQITDYNDDGASDIVIFPHDWGHWQIVSYRSQVTIGDTSYTDTPILVGTDIDGGVGGQGVNNTQIMADLSGTGVQDFLMYYDAGWRVNFANKAINNEGQEAPRYTDYLSKFTSSQGVETEVVYSEQINPEVYTRGAALNDSKLRSVDSGMCLVHKVKQDNGLGGYLTTEYKYKNYVAHTQGLGSFGFEQIETIDVDNEYGDAKEIDTYSHKYVDYESVPIFGFDSRLVAFKNYTYGKLIQSQSVAANGLVLSETSNTYGHYDRSDGSGIYYSFLDQSVSQAYALDDVGNGNYAQVHMSTTTTDYSFANCGSNCYQDSNAGNNTQLVTTVVDHIEGTTHSKTLVNVYGIDRTSDWFLGKVTQSTATSSATGRDSKARSSSWTYDDLTGAVKTETVEPGTADELTTEYVLNAVGVNTQTIVSGADIEQRSSSIQYDSQYRAPTVTTNALGHTTQYSYDPVWLSKTKETSPNGIETFFTFDGFGRSVGVFRADGTYSTTEREDCNSLLSGIGADINCYTVTTGYNSGGTSSQIERDRLGRTLRTLTESVDGKIVLSKNLYDNLGRTIGVSTPYFNGESALWTTSSHYDLLGRPTQVINPESNVSTIQYNATRTVSTNEIGQTKTRFNNGVGEMTQVQDSTGWPVHYRYDVFGKLLTTTDGDGVQVARLEYDQRGNKTLMEDADKGTWHYTYNVLGQLITQTDAANVTTCNAYDVLGRATQRVDQYQGSSTEARDHCAGDGSNPKTSLWYYDTAPVAGLGKPHISLGENGYFQIASYDTLGRPVNNTELIGGQYYAVSTRYDSQGRVDTTEYPNGFTVRNSYNSRSFLDEIANADSGQSYWRIDSNASTMNARGQILNQTFGAGVSQTNTYNNASGLISAIQASNGVSTVVDLSFTFDAIGNLTSKADLEQGISETYSYVENINSVNTNHLNRLTQATAYLNGETIEQSVSYCANGNIKTKSDVGDYTYGSLASGCSNSTGPHAINNITGQVPSTFSYDANGNMTNGNNKVVQYSAFGKPTKIIRGSSEIEFQYGPGRQLIQRIDQHNGNRTEKTLVGGLYEKTNTLDKTTHKYYVGGFLVVSQEDNSDVFEEAYLFKDHLGSVVAITDANGVVKERMAYDPWGKRRNPDWQAMLDAEVYNFQSSVTQKGFTGHEMLDPVGLVHMGGRVYDPVIGRFLSADPFVSDATNTQALNRYSYVENNPLSYTDPSGFFLSKLKKKLKKLRGKIRRHIKRSLQNTFGALGRELRRAMIKHEWLGQVLQIGVCALTSPLGCAAFAGAMTWGMTGDFQAGLMAFTTTYIMAGAGGSEILENMNNFQQAATMGTLSGAVSVAQGGNFKDAFVGGAIGTAAGFLKIKNPFLGASVAAAIGGTTAKATGGSFANGARSAAFSYVVSHRGEFRDALGEFRNSLGTGTRRGAGIAKQAWRKATEWNFEGRDEISKPFEGLSLDEVMAQGEDVWIDMTGIQAKAHQNGRKPEYKFVHKETGAELIFDGDSLQIITKGKYRGTGNYVNAMDIDKLKVWNFPLFAVKGAGHYVADMLPHRILGADR